MIPRMQQHGLGEHDAESAGKLRPEYPRRRFLPDLRNEEDLRRWRDIQYSVLLAKRELIEMRRWRRQRALEVADHFLPALLRKQAE